jgi:dTDP-4-amino-4,6-dideoxy-D-galactose acyltransferase
MSLAPNVTILDWDTDYWGVRAARVQLDSEGQLDDAERLCNDLEVRWASLLVSSGQRTLLGAAVRAGYEVVDIRYEMTMDMSLRAPVARNLEASLEDEAALAAIARSAFTDSRFFNDPRLDDAKCAEFYETWLRNSLDGTLADAVIVDRLASEPAGFVTVRVDGERASLPLVAVAPTHHGLGVGGRLLACTLDWIAAQGVGRVEVVTQLTNVPAIRLYGTAGFRLASSAVWLHRWWD